MLKSTKTNNNAIFFALPRRPHKNQSLRGRIEAIKLALKREEILIQKVKVYFIARPLK